MIKKFSFIFLLANNILNAFFAVLYNKIAYPKIINIVLIVSGNFAYKPIPAIIIPINNLAI